MPDSQRSHHQQGTPYQAPDGHSLLRLEGLSIKQDLRGPTSPYTPWHHLSPQHPQGADGEVVAGRGEGYLSEGGLAAGRSGLRGIDGWVAGSSAHVPPGGCLDRWSSGTCWGLRRSESWAPGIFGCGPPSASVAAWQTKESVEMRDNILIWVWLNLKCSSIP